MAGLDYASRFGVRGGGDAGGAGEELPDRYRIGGVVGALVNHFQRIVPAKNRCRDLDAAGAPAIGQRHLARAERDLMARHRHRLQDGAPDHPLGLLVQIGEVVALHCAPYERCDIVMDRPRAGPVARPRTGSGGPSTIPMRAGGQSRGWPAFAGHDGMGWHAAANHDGSTIIPRPPPVARLPRACGARSPARSENRRNAAASDARRSRSPRCCPSGTARIRHSVPAR